MSPLVHRIALESSGVSFRCRADETVLRAALRAGLGFPYECNSGSCGACRFEVREGGFVMAWPEAPGLNERDRQRGRLLACQAQPRSAAAISVRGFAPAAPLIRPRRQRVRLVGRRLLTHDMWLFTFAGNDPAAFLPGQFAMLELPAVAGERAYSMANLPNGEGIWQFIIKRKPEGKGTAALFEGLIPGAALALDAPFGRAYLRTDSAHPVVCIAGGSGLSPIVSIVRAAIGWRSAPARPVSLFYGGRGPADVVDFASLLGEAATAVCRPVTVLSDADDVPQSTWPGPRGMVHEVVERETGGALGDREVYVAGPPAMVQATLDMLRRNNVEAERVHYDSFY